MSTKELVEIILAQQEIIAKLFQQVEKLTLSRDLDSKISSKPPSSDLLKKPEKKTKSSETEGTSQKRKPGGQLGHTGKTRKGFGRIDRYEVLKAAKCSSCGQLLTETKLIKIEKQSIAQLVAKPIEVVEYQRHHLIKL